MVHSPRFYSYEQPLIHREYRSVDKTLAKKKEKKNEYDLKCDRENDELMATKSPKIQLFTSLYLILPIAKMFYHECGKNSYILRCHFELHRLYIEHISTIKMMLTSATPNWYHSYLCAFSFDFALNSVYHLNIKWIGARLYILI